jgi:hypothetical protein
MNTPTPTLFEALSTARRKYAIAAFEEQEMWASYNLVIDEYTEERTTQAVVNEYGERAERYTDNRKEKAGLVDALKAQILAQPPAPLGVQEPPQDYRIFNRRLPDGTFPLLSEFFDTAAAKLTAPEAAALEAAKKENALRMVERIEQADHAREIHTRYAGEYSIMRAEAHRLAAAILSEQAVMYLPDMATLDPDEPAIFAGGDVAADDYADFRREQRYGKQL